MLPARLFAEQKAQSLPDALRGEWPADPVHQQLCRWQHYAGVIAASMVTTTIAEFRRAFTLGSTSRVVLVDEQDHDAGIATYAACCPNPMPVAAEPRNWDKARRKLFGEHRGDFRHPTMG